MKFYACAIIKNEQLYLEEWIKHYLNLGFTDIILYEDFNSESHKEITDRYPQVQLLKISDYFQMEQSNREWTKRQERIYRKFLYSHTSENAWVGFFDIDEFLVFNNNYTLEKFAATYKNKNSIGIFWKMFNANGLIEAEPGKNTIGTFTKKCQFLDTDYGWNFKTLYNLNKLNFIVDCHSARVEETTDGRVLKTGYKNSIPPNYEVAQLNHYYTKSFKDWLNRFSRGDININHRKFDGFFILNPEFKPAYKLLNTYYLTHNISFEELKSKVKEMIKR